MKTDSLLRRLTATTIFFCLQLCVAQAQVPVRYPAAEWEKNDPAQTGWSASQLGQAEDWSRGIGSAAVVIVQHGAIVASWGETSADILLNSARKSLLSALIGIAVAHHQIDLDDTVGKLGIDDSPPSLTEDEKQATVRDLLEARSGVTAPTMRHPTWLPADHHGVVIRTARSGITTTGISMRLARSTSTLSARRSSQHSLVRSPLRSECRTSIR